MDMNQLIAMNAEMTMSSREIASIVGASHHNMLKTIRSLVSDGVISGNETPYEHEQNGQTYPEFLLNFRDTMVVMSGFRADLRAKIIDRWQELEAQAKPQVPQTYAAALLEAGRLALELEQKEAQLAIAAPKAEFVDRYVDATGTYGFRQVAKMLSVKENWFSDFLIEKEIMYRLGGKLTAHSDHLDAGRFVARAGVAKNEHAFTECRFTAKGVEWVAGEIAKHKAVAAIAKK